MCGATAWDVRIHPNKDVPVGQVITADPVDEDSSDSDVHGFGDPMEEAEQYGSPQFGPSGSLLLEEKDESSALSKREILTADRLRGSWHCVSRPQSIMRETALIGLPPEPAPRPAAGIKVTAGPGPILMVTRPLPRVLLLHTGGTLGMDPMARPAPPTCPASTRCCAPVRALSPGLHRNCRKSAAAAASLTSSDLLRLFLRRPPSRQTRRNCTSSRVPGVSTPP